MNKLLIALGLSLTIVPVLTEDAIAQNTQNKIQLSGGGRLGTTFYSPTNGDVLETEGFIRATKGNFYTELGASYTNGDDLSFGTISPELGITTGSRDLTGFLGAGYNLNLDTTQASDAPYVVIGLTIPVNKDQSFSVVPRLKYTFSDNEQLALSLGLSREL